MIPRVEVIINASAGTANKHRVELLTKIFADRGVDARISLAESGAHLKALITKAVEDDVQTVVAGGGDGTVSAVASALVGTERTLGVLPMGTLNHFAKDLQVPLDLEAAALTIIAGYAIRIDVGEVNERIFVNNSSLGLYPSIVHQRKKVEKLGHGKWPAFLWAAVTVLRRYPFLDVSLLVDGTEFRTRTPFVFVGNNVYENESFNIGRRARLDAGVLNLYVSNRTSRIGLLQRTIRALLRRLRETDDFLALTTTELTVATRGRRSTRVATDGEVTMMPTPLHYRIRPGALRVLVPENREGSSQQ